MIKFHLVGNRNIPTHHAWRSPELRCFWKDFEKRRRSAVISYTTSGPLSSKIIKSQSAPVWRGQHLSGIWSFKGNTLRGSSTNEQRFPKVTRRAPCGWLTHRQWVFINCGLKANLGMKDTGAYLESWRVCAEVWETERPGRGRGGYVSFRESEHNT